MLVPKVKLIPTQDQVLDLLKETGALRGGHIELPSGMHSSLYFQMPLAMRYHGNARTLNVALSRLLRMVPEVLAALPDCAIVAPAAGGIPVAFGVREALDADQIFWALYTAHELETQLKDAGAEVIAIGSLVHFKGADPQVGDIPYQSLVDIDVKFNDPENCPMCKAGEPVEKVWV